jgi:molybdenum cofactor cytidylyltransferase
VVPIAGIEALGRPLREACHRPERVAALTGLAVEEPLTAAALAALIAHPQGGLKGAPAEARVVPFLNQVETADQMAEARRVARAILRLTRLERVVIGAARAARPVLEVQRPVTAAVLAAGQSRRMGRNKLLLPWGETTVLGQTLSNLTGSAVHDVVVVSGHDPGPVEGIAADHGAAWLHNPDYREGEMLSSLQLAVRSTAPRTAAVLVVLADQPMVGPETIDRLLVAFWQGQGEIVAPVYEGQRGNPVLIGRPFFDELLALPAGAAPRDLLGRHPEAIHLVEVETAAVLQDLDEPDQYERWRPGG